MARLFTKISILILILAGGLGYTATAVAENGQASAIVNEMLKRDAMRRSGVDGYITVEAQSIGSTAVVYHEKMSDQLGYRIVGADELESRVAPADANQVESAAKTFRDQMSKYFKEKYPSGSNSSDAETESVSTIMNNTSFLSNPMGTLSPEAARESAEQSLSDMREFASKANIVERQTYLGREAFLVGASNLNKKQVTEDGVFTIEKMALWIDADNYLLLGMNAYGTSETADFDGPQPFEIHQTSEAYSKVDGSNLMIPHEVGMGVKFDFMSQQSEKERAKSRKEFEQAKKQFDMMQEQMKNAPPAQRKMMENIMKQSGVDISGMMNQVENLYEGDFMSNYQVIATADIGDLEDFVAKLKEYEANGEAANQANMAREKAKRAAAEGLPTAQENSILNNEKF